MMLSPPMKPLPKSKEMPTLISLALHQVKMKKLKSSLASFEDAPLDMSVFGFGDSACSPIEQAHLVDLEEAIDMDIADEQGVVISDSGNLRFLYVKMILKVCLCMVHLPYQHCLYQPTPPM